MIKIKIALLGDIALFGKFTLKNKNIKKYFSKVKNLLQNFDYVIGNLETPLTNSKNKFGVKSAHIKSDIENVNILNYLGVNIVNLANNHIYDYGIKGYEDTKDILDNNNIKYFGIENKQLFLEKDNNKIALSGYCGYSTNGLGYYNDKTKKGVNILNGFKVEKILIENYKKGYLNIASFHIGEEHVNYPNYDHILLARKLSEKVPYIFYGHHPHVIQGIEEYNDSLIAYSLGNFCFDDVYNNKSKEPLIKQSENNKSAFILALNIENNEILDKKIIPIYLGDNEMIIGSNKIEENIKIYSERLNMEKNDYINMRNELINKYISDRKKKRNYEWYLKRLNLETMKRIIQSKSNKKKYMKAVKKYIN